MTARHTLLGLFEAWRLQTETEGEAIRIKDWNTVSECQRVKDKLQPLIKDWTGAARRELQAAGRDRQELERELRTLLQEMIQAEGRNQAWLSEHQANLSARRFQAQQTVSNLRRIRRSYAPQSRSVWQSYS